MPGVRMHLTRPISNGRFTAEDMVTTDVEDDQMKLQLTLAIGAAVALGMAEARAGDAAAGKARYLVNCVNCHGKAGKGMASFPSIVGRNADYVAGRLTKYRAREKVGPNSAIMMSLASELSDEEIANLAAYVSTAFALPDEKAEASENAGRPPAAPEDGGPRRWEVKDADGISMHDEPAADAPVIETLAGGAILSNHGCERAGGRVWCTVKSLRGRARGHVVADLLRPARGPDGAVPMGTDDSAVHARNGDFDASGTIPCAQERGQPMSECTFGVARSSGGDATVVVTSSNGFKRTLYFTHGEFIRADTTMSGNGFDTDWRKEGDLHTIRVDDQRYELPDTDVFGG